MLYKDLPKKKAANLRQTFWCILIGSICGVYGFQPILKILNKDEGGLILKIINEPEETMTQTESEEPAQEK